jgi:hypothetical protein
MIAIDCSRTRHTLGTPPAASTEDNDGARPPLGRVARSRGANRGPTPSWRADLGQSDAGDENAITVAWEVLGGSTSGQDYVLTNGTLFAHADPEATPFSNRGVHSAAGDRRRERGARRNVLIRLRTPTELPSGIEAPPTLVTNGVLDVCGDTYVVDDDQSEITVGGGVGNGRGRGDTGAVHDLAERPDEPGADGDVSSVGPGGGRERLPGFSA